VEDLPMEVLAAARISQMVGNREPLPLLHGWTLAASATLTVLNTILQAEPSSILEIGSGASTRWINAHLRETGRAGATRIVSLEHQSEFLQTLKPHLNNDASVDLRFAPLVDIDLDGARYRWYSRSAWQDLANVDLLLVDGPPGMTGPLARYPALPLLWDTLSDNAYVLLDDCDRPEERFIAQEWLRIRPGEIDVAEEVGRMVVFRVNKQGTVSA
jgi:hypothetical protein